MMSLAGGGIMPPMLGYIARQTGAMHRVTWFRCQVPRWSRCTHSSARQRAARKEPELTSTCPTQQALQVRRALKSNVLR